MGGLQELQGQENNKVIKMNLAESAIVTLVGDLKPIEMVAIYSMVSGIEFPESVTKLHLAKIIYTLCQKLGWITETQTDAPIHKDEMMDENNKINSFDEYQESLKITSDSNLPNLDPIIAEEQSSDDTRKTQTETVDESFDSFIADDQMDFEVDKEKLINNKAQSDVTEKEQETQKGDKKVCFGPPPQICIDTLSSLVDKYQPMGTKENWEQGKRWNAITFEYSQLRPNFNGNGYKNKRALRKFYSRSRKHMIECSSKGGQPTLKVHSDKDGLMFDSIGADEPSLNESKQIQTESSDDSLDNCDSESAMDSEEDMEEAFGIDNAQGKIRKKKQNRKLSAKGPLPQICIDTLHDLVDKYQPSGTKETWEQRNRWDAITFEYSVLRPNFNGFGFKDKKALRNFYSRNHKIKFTKEEEQRNLKVPLDKNHQKNDATKSDEQGLKARRTGTDVNDENYECFIADDSSDVRENIEEKQLEQLSSDSDHTKCGAIKEGIQSSNLEIETFGECLDDEPHAVEKSVQSDEKEKKLRKCTKTKNNLVPKGPLPQICIDTLTNLVNTYLPPTATIENWERGKRWDTITFEYSVLRPNFNGFGFKDKKALRNFYSRNHKIQFTEEEEKPNLKVPSDKNHQKIDAIKSDEQGFKARRTGTDVNDENYECFIADDSSGVRKNIEENKLEQLSSDSDHTKCGAIKEDIQSSNLEIETLDKFGECLGDEPHAVEKSVQSDEKEKKLKKCTKTKNSLVPKGPLPQICIDTLTNLVNTYLPPTAAIENLERGKRWDIITREYSELKPDFNGFGYKNKKALRKFYSANKTIDIPPQPGICIDTLNDLVDKYKPIEAKNDNDQGDRWNSIAFEYADLRSNFNGSGYKSKEALKRFYKKHYQKDGLDKAHVKEMSMVNSSRSLICSTCGAKFKRSDILKKHEVVHTGDKNFCCFHCGKKFARLNNLRQHEAFHNGEKTYACSHCDKKFLTKGHKECHEKIHSLERPFSCSICDMKFKRKDNCKRHETVSHPMK